MMSCTVLMLVSAEYQKQAKEYEVEHATDIDAILDVWGHASRKIFQVLNTMRYYLRVLVQVN